LVYRQGFFNPAKENAHIFFTKKNEKKKALFLVAWSSCQVFWKKSCAPYYNLPKWNSQKKYPGWQRFGQASSKLN
jgi:hypothetical protein